MKRSALLILGMGLLVSLSGLRLAVLAGKETAASLPQSTCTTLKTQGYLGGCSTLTVFWLSQTPQNQVTGFKLHTFAGVFPLGNELLPSSAKSFQLSVPCGSGGQVQITEFRTNGTTCTAQYTGNLPHNRQCGDAACAGSSGGRASVVSAANYRSNVAALSIASVFGDADFTTETEPAYDADPFSPGVQLPTKLANVQVMINGMPAGLFFVSPKQINFLVPALSEGLHGLQVVTPDGRTVFGDVLITANAPGVFTVTNTGEGLAAAQYIVSGSTIYVVLYATGLNNGNVTLRMNNREYVPSYFGPAPGYLGLQQINFPIHASEFPTGQTGAVLTIRNTRGFWDAQGVLLRKP